MSAHVTLQFQDTTGHVRLCNDAGLMQALAAILKRWPSHTPSGDEAQGTPAIRVDRNAGAYELTSRWLNVPERRRDPVDLVCALVIEIVWAYLDAHPEQLCLHGAAAEFNGRLVVFPNRYQAGKSLLTGCLAAAGQRIFTDDILPLRIDPQSGIVSGRATGVPPRLRLPLPDNLAPHSLSFMSQCVGAQSQFYRYLDLPDDLQAPRNLGCPVGGFVLLERQPGTTPHLAPMTAGQMLREVVWQNFARAMPSGRILHILQGLVGASPCHVLRYDRADAAVQLLQDSFADWSASLPRITPFEAAPEAGCELADLPGNAQTEHYARCPGVYEHGSGADHFLADAQGGAIHHLNETAGVIWRLLDQPMRFEDIHALFVSAFPDQAEEVIAEDLHTLLEGLQEKSLIRRVSPRVRADDNVPARPLAS